MAYALVRRKLEVPDDRRRLVTPGGVSGGRGPCVQRPDVRYSHDAESASRATLSGSEMSPRLNFRSVGLSNSGASDNVRPLAQAQRPLR